MFVARVSLHGNPWSCALYDSAHLLVDQDAQLCKRPAAVCGEHIDTRKHEVGLEGRLVDHDR